MDPSSKGRNPAWKWIGVLCVVWGLTACTGMHREQGTLPAPGKPEAAAKTTPPPKAVHPKTVKKAAEPVVQSEPVEYVGLRIPPMPEGHESVMGYLLDGGDEGNFSIEVVHFGPQKLVWMGQLLYHDANGRAHWEIIAVLPPRKVPKGYYFSDGNCRDQGHPNPKIVALFKREDKKTFTQISKAWRADTQAHHFVELSPEGIQCLNEAWNRL